MKYAVYIIEHITNIQLYTFHKAHDITHTIWKFAGLWQEVYTYL